MIDRLSLRGNEYGDTWLEGDADGEYVLYADHAAALAASETKAQRDCHAIYMDMGAKLEAAEQLLANRVGGTP